MTPPTTASGEELLRGRVFADRRAAAGPVAGAVSWGAIVAGAAAAAALSMILLILGVGLGLSSVSPWPREGASAAAFGVSTILWLTLTQLLASAMGGYLAGRLRTRWSDVPTDEVYFRDTAHGFLAWAVASLATAWLLGSVFAFGAAAGLQAGAQVATTAGTATVAAVNGKTMPAAEGESMSYYVESMFRREAGASTATPVPAEVSEGMAAKNTAEVSRIFMTNINDAEALPTEDLRYVGQIVAQRTGLSRLDAEKRVADTYARAQAAQREAEAAARNAADQARRASAYSALWLFVSLLIGAFVASLAATYGGRQRDAGPALSTTP